MHQQRHPFGHPAALRLGAAQHGAVTRLVKRVTGMVSSSVLIDGVRVPYVQCGRGAPLLLLHGFGDRKDTFAPLTVLLHRKYRVIAMDFPGFGEASVVPSSRVSAPAQSKFIAAFIAELGLGKVHVVGQSMGGAIAARFADEHPELTRSLTLISPAGPWGLTGDVDALIEAGRNPLLVRNFDDFERLCDMSFVKQLPYPRPMIQFLARQWSLRRAELAGHFQRLIYPPAGEELADRFENVHCPTQVIYGTGEQLVDPRNIKTYRGAFVASKLTMLDGVGHNPHHEATYRTARLIRALAKRADHGARG